MKIQVPIETVTNVLRQIIADSLPTHIRIDAEQIAGIGEPRPVSEDSFAVSIGGTDFLCIVKREGD